MGNHNTRFRKEPLEKGQPIKVVDDQWRMPTLAEDLAEGCIRIAQRGATGIYHLSGPDGMSILELVHRVGRFFGLPVDGVLPAGTTVTLVVRNPNGMESAPATLTR